MRRLKPVSGAPVANAQTLLRQMRGQTISRIILWAKTSEFEFKGCARFVDSCLRCRIEGVFVVLELRSYCRPGELDCVPLPVSAPAPWQRTFGGCRLLSCDFTNFSDMPKCKLQTQRVSDYQ